MRIGLMLRSLDERGGIGVYTRNLVEELLRLDSPHHFVLFYRQPSNLGRYGPAANVTERWVKGAGKAVWDQVAIPWACRRERIDVLFHPKFTVPLLAPCTSIMVVHGADWFIPEQARFYNRLDVAYIRAVMPWYFRKAAAVISVSELTTRNFQQVLDLPPGKIRTVYFGPARHFARVENPSALRQVRERYRLPARFAFTISKVGDGGRKNFTRLLEAYAEYHRRSEDPHALVVGGAGCDEFRDRYGIPADGFGRDVHFPGWIEQSDLPAVYSLAGVFLYPSNLEAFPIPITEAMACGTPIVTSNVNGLEEIAGDAALLVDPRDPVAIARALGRVLGNPVVQSELARAGLDRSRTFSWSTCARKTLAIMEEVVGTGPGRAGRRGIGK